MAIAATCLTPAAAASGAIEQSLSFINNGHGKPDGNWGAIGIYESSDGATAYCLNQDLQGPGYIDENGTYVAWHPYSYSAVAEHDYAYLALHGYPRTTTIGGQELSAELAQAATQLAIWMLNGTTSTDGMRANSTTDFKLWPDGERVVAAAAALADEARADTSDLGDSGILVYTTNLPNTAKNPHQPMLYVPQGVTVTFTKTSTDASLTEGNDEYAYAGAVYEVFRESDDTLVATITTDETGHASCLLAPNESYYAVERQAPAGFALSDERVRFQTGTDDGNVTLVDRPGSVRLHVQKRDSATGGAAQAGLTLGGAEYRFTSRSDPSWQRTITTNEQGYALVADVPLGVVEVVETKAPLGYRLDPTVHTYTVRAGDLSAEGVADLEPQEGFAEPVIAFDLEIAKTKGGEDPWDESDGHGMPAAGVHFEVVSNTTGEVVGTLVTNESGFASSADAATVGSESTADDRTHDPAKPWFGAGRRGPEHSGAIPFDPKGYTVREVAQSVPDGFDRVDDWVITPEQLADGATLQYSVVDKTLDTRLQIVKTDAETGQVVPLEGFAFCILAEDGGRVIMTDCYPGEATIDEFVTDERGMVTLPQRLTPGNYTLHELGAQPPYLLDEAGVALTVSPDHEHAQPTTVVKVADRQARGRATITKTCSASGGGTIDPGCAHVLAGVEFDVVARGDVISPDGTVRAREGDVVDHVVTNDEGRATTRDLYLGTGSATYAFVETVPPSGHVLDATQHEFTLSYGDQDTPLVVVSVEAGNAPTELIVNKTALGSDQPLEGACFKIWRVDEGEGEGIDEGVNRGEDGEADEGKDGGVGEAASEDQGDDAPKANETSDRTPDTYEAASDAEGRLVVRHLSPGTYRLRETSAPAGYLVGDTTYEFTIDEDGLVEGKPSHAIDVENDCTKVDVSKRDITNEQEIPGARLTITNGRDEVVESWVSGETERRIEALPPGTYVLTEVVTPHAYDQANSVTFTVEPTGDVQRVVMYDEPITVTGQIDKRQEIADPTHEGTESNGDAQNRANVTASDDGSFAYSLDFRSTSSTWVDELTVTDELDGVAAGVARLTSITTPQARGDHDGKMNVWFTTNKTNPDALSDEANATISDGHENPWLGDPSNAERLGEDGRALDYAGWRLWRENVSTEASQTLPVDELGLADGEHVTGVRLEYGRVEAGFTTRPDGWDRDDLKHEHDDLDRIEGEHGETFARDEGGCGNANEGTADGTDAGAEAGADADDTANTSSEAHYAPAVLHMQVTDDYREGTVLENRARVDLFRDGGGEQLEDHDEDRVTQRPTSDIVPLAQTGSAARMLGIMLACWGLVGVLVAVRSANPPARGGIRGRRVRRRGPIGHSSRNGTR